MHHGEQITTPRLMLRKFCEADVDPFHQLVSQEGVLRYFPKGDPPPREGIQRMVQGQAKHWDKYGYGLWAVILRADGTLIGRSGLQYLPETQETEIDFILGQPYWGQGFGTEAGQAGLSFAFETLGLDQVVGIVHPENQASRRLLEKLGMGLTRMDNYFGMDVCRYAIQRPPTSRQA